jgi:hypothetical protein
VSGLTQHALAKDIVGAGLVALAGLFEPRYYVGVQAHGDGLFYGAIELAANRIFPCAKREFGDVGGVDLAIR